MTKSMMTCDEFQALLPDYLEDGALATPARGRTDAQSRGRMDALLRDRADAHRLDCAECAALVADLRDIARKAGDLPLLEPSCDLWSGIESRIAAEVVALPVAGRAVESVPARHARPVVHRTWTTRRLAIAASLLVMMTAGITWTVARRRPVLVIPAEPVTTNASPNAANATPDAMNPAPGATLVANAGQKPSMDETYGREIAALRKIVDERRAELDSNTIGVLEKNLLIIDKAIRESRAALARDPASTFLNDRLSSAYDTKLQLLRAVATIPAHT